MTDISDLYQELILDHSKRPRNQRVPEGSSHSAIGHNPLCGDRLSIHIVLEGETVRDVGWKGVGCAISTASASTMTESVKGKSRGEIDRLFHAFHEMLTGKAVGDEVELGKLAAFSGVCEFPVRVKCATLPWHTLQAALEGKREVSTE